MDNFFSELFNKFKEMPLSRKLSMATIVFFLVAGFGSIVLWANKSEFKPIYKDLSSDDSAAIIQKLKDNNVEYRIEKDGSSILVPMEKLHELRLEFAGEGIPKGGGVGFEIFDETDFGTTEFVQKLNYQRALQGELARTIREMDEVKDAKVLIVMPKDSVFVEESKPPSASVFLKLRSKMKPNQVKAVVHLVASSIEDLTPELVTVVDSNGKVLSKGLGDKDPDELINSRLKYKVTYEQSLGNRIQSMLEDIVGHGKAIVRVTADMDFAQVDTNEEVYNPDTPVIRSRQTSVDKSSKQNTNAENISSVNPLARGTTGDSGISVNKEHEDQTVNYEISRVVTNTVNPVGNVTRLSVAAILDGTYKTEVNDSGKKEKKFSPRTPEEINRFTTIIKQAMGYSEDREDKISVETMAFASSDVWKVEEEKLDWNAIKKEYGKAIANILLVALVFLFVVRPLIKTFKDTGEFEDDKDLLGESEDEYLLSDTGGLVLPKPKVATIQDKAAGLAKENINKTANILKGWISE